MSDLGILRTWGGSAAALLMLLATGEGLLLLLKIGRIELRGVTRAATAFTLGVAVIGTWSLILHLSPMKVSPLLLALPIVLYPAGRVIFAKGISATGATSIEPNPAPAAGPLMRLAIAVTSFQILYALHHALTRPIHAWDAWKIWSFRAKVIFFEQGFPVDFFTSDWAGFPGYPLGIPLVEVFFATMVGEWHETAIKLIFPVFYAAVTIFFVALIRTGRTKRGAAAGLLLLAPAPLLVHHGAVAYMDLPLACFLLGAVTWLVRWERNGNEKYLLLAAMHAGFLTQIKNEGIPFYLLLSLILLLRARLKGGAALVALRWFAASLPFALPWLLFKFGGGIPDSPYHTLAFPGGAAALSRSGEFIRLSAESLFLSGSWGIAWYPLLLIPLLRKKISFSTPGIILAGGFLLFAATYALTDSYIFLKNGTALGRNLLVLFPVAVAWGVRSLFGNADQGAG